MTPEEARTGAPDSSAAASAWSEREARLGSDIAAMQQGPVEHLTGLTDHHQGRPTVQKQMHTHVPPPKTPDTGGHG